MVDPVSIAIITGLTVALISGVILALMKRRWENKDKDDEKLIAEELKKTTVDDTNATMLKEVQKSVWRLNKTVLIIAKILDDQTTKIHPELTSSLEDIATELLKETG